MNIVELLSSFILEKINRRLEQRKEERSFKNWDAV